MKSIQIKGKDYVQVNERVKAFRSEKAFQGYSIVTTIHDLTDDVCVMCAQIHNAEGAIVSTGWAREVRNDATSMVNKTSYVENCETSAVGRALGFLGIGIDTAICSAEELYYAQQAAEAAQNVPKMPSNTITPKPQENAADANSAPKKLSEREQMELEQAKKAADAANTLPILRALWNRYRSAAFADEFTEYCQKIKDDRGWN